MKYLHLSLWILLSSLLINCGGGASQRDIVMLDPDDESGIGGTGILAQESGMGGTGIIGEVTGFGSIFVNGVEVEFDQRTPLYLNGQAVEHYNLELGDVVETLTHKKNGMTVADEIHIRHEVIGAVEKINPQSRTMTVLGQEVVLIKQAQSLPQRGQTIQVSGFRDQDGRIHATRIVQTKQKQSLLAGVLRKIGKAYYIGQQKVIFPTNVVFNKGTSLRVEGEIRNGILRVAKHSLLKRLSFTQAVDHLVVQGIVKKQYGQQYKIGDRVFEATSSQLHKQLSTQIGQIMRVEIRRNQQRWQVNRIISQKGLAIGRPRPTVGPRILRPVVPDMPPRRNESPQRFMR